MKLRSLLILLLFFTGVYALNVSKVIYYWNLQSPPEGLNKSITILKDLQPQMIWYSYWITGFPIPPDSRKAYSIALSCGLSETKAKEFSKWVEMNHYTLQDLKKQVNVAKSLNIIYCPAILGYTNFRIDFNYDPCTFKCLSKNEIKSMLLNFGKWGIINPKTRKPYTLEETQELFYERGLPRHNGVFDLSSTEFKKYMHDKFLVLKKVGINTVWLDLYFQLPLNLARGFGFNSKMVKDLYNGACDIVDDAKGLGFTVGTWYQALEFPYSRVPNLDFVTASPSTEEVESINIDYSRWDKIASIVKSKCPRCELIIIFDFANRDNPPLPVFSQKLTPEQQSEFLVKLHNLADYIEKKYGIKTAVAYPVHGPGLGRNPTKLAWGKYDIYDALAPEFDTYFTIKSLMINKNKSNTTKTMYGSRYYIITIILVVVMILLIFIYIHSKLK